MTGEEIAFTVGGGQRYTGKVSRVRIPARAVARPGDAPVLSARLARLREGRFDPETMRALDGDDLRALRPAVIVRTPRAFTPAAAGRERASSSARSCSCTASAAPPARSAIR